MTHIESDDNRGVWFAKQVWRYGWGLILVIALTLLAKYIPQHGFSGASPSPAPTSDASTPSVHSNQ